MRMTFISGAVPDSLEHFSVRVCDSAGLRNDSLLYVPLRSCIRTFSLKHV